MTKRIYWENPYQTAFSAKVEKVEGKNVWLDQTCFYPESGGQAGDTGTMNGQKVIDTKFDQDKNIFHVMENETTLKTGDSVEGVIDWERRYKIMKIHSASHIMEHFLFKIFGQLKLTGSHLNEKHDSSTYESAERLDQEKLSMVEKEVNDFISQNLPIETYPDEKKPNYRWWKCGDILIPCGGTHPRNTSFIYICIIVINTYIH
ncbi:MAG: Putative metal-dependent hydrolase [Parcubacteria bacterium 32_520]|nr:MAG: Putative metal-dependent hydrolase [Parcubacteria bacterium 32_520]